MTEPLDGRGTPRRPVAVPVASLLIVTVVGIITLLGGLEEAEAPPKPLGQGAVLDQGLYSTAFVEARVNVEKAELSFEEDKRFVEMVFDVTNLGEETVSVGLPPAKPEEAGFGHSFANSLVRISPAIKKDKGPFAFALAGDDQTNQLHPGLKTKVIVRYRLDPGEQPPDKITLDVASFEYSPGFQDETVRWQLIREAAGETFVPTVQAQVTLPVKAGDTA
ncbi:hypothetical protein ACQEUU_06745 [Nonomuraea sp. CA-218870]|uniref:hypothetical protein n=1 Tax=Nonomuraea sp. CA-218870 TaxID=3239998 RepID=UPI003D8F0449